MTMDKIKISLFMVILLGIVTLVSSSSPSFGIFKQNDCFEIKQICFINGTICDACNITSIDYPNGTMASSNLIMTQREGDFNLSYCSTTLLGRYNVNGYCTYGDDVKKPFVAYFDITASGSKLGTAEGIIYIVFVSALILTFLLFLYGSFVIPYRHMRGDDGKIVSVNDVKYFKVVCIVFSYLTLMSIFAVMRQISANYLFLNGVSNIFQWMFWFMLSFTFPTIIVSVIFALVAFFEDKKIKNALERGVPIR